MFKYAIALTGNIASGKSTISKMLRDDGFTVIDADFISHEILDEYPNDINDIFKENLLIDEKIDRKKLGNLIFSYPEIRSILEEFMHPLILNRIEELSIIEDKKRNPIL